VDLSTSPFVKEKIRLMILKSGVPPVVARYHGALPILNIV